MAEDLGDRPRSWMAALKQRRSIAVLVFAAAIAAGIAGFLDSARKIAEGVRLIAAKPQIIAFELSPAAVGFGEERLPSLTPLRADDLRTFTSNDDAPGHRAVFLITVDNPRPTDLILTELIVDVEATGFYAGTGAGPLDALATYRHSLQYREGRQRRALVPPFRVPASSAASFDLAVTSPANVPTDTPVWIMTVGLTGGGYTLRTDRIQLLMSVGGAKETNTPSNEGAN